MVDIYCDCLICQLEEILHVCGRQMAVVPKLRLCTNFEGLETSSPTAIVCDLDLKDDRTERLAQWLKGQDFKVIKTKTGKALLKWIETVISNSLTAQQVARSNYYGKQYRTILGNFFDIEDLTKIKGYPKKALDLSFSTVKANMALLDKLFQTLSFSKLTDLSQEASLRLFKSFKCYCSKDVETIIADLDLANDRKQRLDAWMHQEFGLCRPCCLPFANCLNLLEWLDDAFEWAEKEVFAGDYRYYIFQRIKASTSSRDGTGAVPSTVVGQYFSDKPQELGISYADIQQNIRLLQQIVQLYPLLNTKPGTAESFLAKLRLFYHFKTHRNSDPAVVVEDLVVADGDRIQQLDLWLAHAQLASFKTSTAVFEFFNSLPPQNHQNSIINFGTNMITSDFFEKTPPSPSRSPIQNAFFEMVGTKTTFSMIKKMLVGFDKILQICPSLSTLAKIRILHSFGKGRDSMDYRKILEEGNLDPARVVADLDLRDGRVADLDAWLGVANLSSFKTSMEVRATSQYTGSALVCSLSFSLSLSLPKSKQT